MDRAPTQSHVDTGISHSQADDLYRRAVENDIKDYAIFLTDTAGRVINWNRGAERILGYKESEIIGQSADIFFTPEDRAAKEPEHEMETATTTGRAEDERWHLRRDQSRFWASGILTPVHNEAGDLIGFIKVMQDMTERRKLEGERDRLFALSMDMLCIVHLDGYFLRTNPAFERLLGYTTAELQNRLGFELLHRQPWSHQLPATTARNILELRENSTGQARGILTAKNLDARFRGKLQCLSLFPHLPKGNSPSIINGAAAH